MAALFEFTPPELVSRTSKPLSARNSSMKRSFIGIVDKIPYSVEDIGISSDGCSFISFPSAFVALRVQAYTSLLLTLFWWVKIRIGVLSNTSDRTRASSRANLMNRCLIYSAPYRKMRALYRPTAQREIISPNFVLANYPCFAGEKNGA